VPKLPRALLASTAALFLFASGSLTTALLFRSGSSSHYKRSTQTIKDASGGKTIINYTLTDEPSQAKRKGGAKAARASTSASATSATDATTTNAAAQQQMAACPPSGNGHEYMVVWAGKMNAADLTGKDAITYAQGGAVNPEGIKEVLPQELVPGQDMMVTIDAEQGCDTYGKVVNIALIPGADGLENEPHHMQYIWFPGESVWAGGLFTSRLFTYDMSKLPQVRLVHVDEPWSTPGGSIWDAFDALPDGSAYGTLMGGPLYAYGMTPGEVVHIGPDGKILGEFSAGAPEGLPPIDTNGLPTCPDLGSCANPHGIQARADLHRLVTSDYAEPARIIEDPTKPENFNIFRRTVREWDITDTARPKLIKVDVMPKGPRDDSNPGHAENLGIMEVGKTWDYPLANGTVPKGMFAESMCGGAIFYTSDITDTTNHPWREVFDSTTAVLSPKAQSAFSGQVPNGGPNSQITEAGGCDGAAWLNVTPDNRFLLHAINGRYTNQDDFADSGTPKMLYALDVQKLLAAGSHYQCNIDNIRAVNDSTNGGPDCPTVAGVAPVNDTSSGGPHWGAFDNFNLGTVQVTDPVTHQPFTDTHAVTRLAFANYFVARTGVDGNHKLCMLNMDPQTGDLSFDNTFIDEKLGTPCVDFNRKHWPGGATTGYYKPHSMLFVENDPPKAGATAVGTPTYWGHEINNGVDAGGLPYTP
jgi:hypothetical protein